VTRRHEPRGQGSPGPSSVRSVAQPVFPIEYGTAMPSSAHPRSAQAARSARILAVSRATSATQGSCVPSRAPQSAVGWREPPPAPAARAPRARSHTGTRVPQLAQNFAPGGFI
jgi:hypothetical protein